MKAHDVRHLTVCPACGDLGDRRTMLRVGKEHLHGDCAFKRLGEEGLLALPREEVGKVRLCDVPRSVMTRLLDAMTA